MSVSKAHRQHRIGQLLGRNPVTSQTQLVDLLHSDGVIATQATVSRDLEELGAVKLRVAAGEPVYAIPKLPREQIAPADHLRKIMSEWVVQVSHSGNLAVVHTPPGCAHMVGSAIDRAGLDSVVGTLGGDDTVLVVATGAAGGQTVADLLRELASLPGDPGSEATR